MSAKLDGYATSVIMVDTKEEAIGWLHAAFRDGWTDVESPDGLVLFEGDD